MLHKGIFLVLKLSLLGCKRSRLTVCHVALLHFGHAKYRSKATQCVYRGWNNHSHSEERTMAVMVTAPFLRS